jgi:phosphatidate cytidylyltransferase
LSTFLQRTVTGAIYVAAVVGSILLSSTLFFLLFFAVNIFTLKEFSSMMKTGSRISLQKHVLIICGSIAYLLISLSSMHLIPLKTALPVLAIPLLLMITELYRNEQQPLMNVAGAMLAIVYISVPFALLNFMPAYQNITHAPTPWLLLAFFVVLWINDTFAYLTGKLMGKHHIFKRISPKKTWEGTIGGILFSLAAGYVFAQFSTILMTWQWLTLAGLIAVSGIFGDFTESMFKRSFNIKDSGHILPGHGGLLDRFDSLLFAAPAAIIFLFIIK